MLKTVCITLSSNEGNASNTLTTQSPIVYRIEGNTSLLDFISKSLVLECNPSLNHTSLREIGKCLVLGHKDYSTAVETVVSAVVVFCVLAVRFVIMQTVWVTPVCCAA